MFNPDFVAPVAYPLYSGSRGPWFQKELPRGATSCQVYSLLWGCLALLSPGICHEGRAMVTSLQDVEQRKSANVSAWGVFEFLCFLSTQPHDFSPFLPLLPLLSLLFYSPALILVYPHPPEICPNCHLNVPTNSWRQRFLLQVSRSGL